MPAKEYQDTIRFTLENVSDMADEFGNWEKVRSRLAQSIERLMLDADTNVTGLERALTALQSDAQSETERAYLTACGLAVALKEILNKRQ